MTVTKTLHTNLTATLLESTQEKQAENTGLAPYLVILSGLDQGKQYRLDRQFNIFGRAGDIDIKIVDAKISRKHGAFIIYPDCIILEDYQSTNGCYVNDIRVERQVIESTSRIRVGSTVMKIEYKKANEVESEHALYQAANTDALTNISNRRAFILQAGEKVSVCKLNNDNLAIIMCDVDFFKKINDNFGHPAGDQVLKDLAIILQGEMRKDDMLARYGGEEFIMLLHNTDINAVSKLAERIRQKVEQFDFSFEGALIPTTLSIGVCCRNGEEITSLNNVIKEADEALYRAKHNGRNRVEII